jgi:hypothetical protein
MLGRRLQRLTGEAAGERYPMAPRGKGMRPFVVTAVLLGAVVLGVAGCKSESEHDRMVKLVNDSLKKEGIQAGVEPVVELTKKGEDTWAGTATYGDIVYDLRVYKVNGELMLERQMRPPSK